MKKLFVSYAREDRGRVEPLVALLRDEGFDVFWDTTMPSGVEWPEFLDAQLASAQVLLVLWTPDSVASRWVRTEAHEALLQGKLMPVSLDEVRPPFAFRQINAFDLLGWRGDMADPRLARLMAELHARLDAGLAADPDVAADAEVVPDLTPPPERPIPPAPAPAPAPPPAPPPALPDPTPPPRTGWRWLLAGATVLAVLGYWAWPWFAVAPAPAPSPTSASSPGAASAAQGFSSAPVQPASQPPKSRPANQKKRCDAINEQLKMGIPVSDADRNFLKSGC